jgi:hypothetical protein
MRATLYVHLAIATALLAPAVLAGSASDAAGDAPGHLDLVSLTLTTGAATWSGRSDRDVVATIKLADLGAAAPAADSDAESSRYYYHLTFTPTSLGQEVTIVCYIAFLDNSAVAYVGSAAGEVGVGTDCTRLRNSHGATILETVPQVNVQADTLTIRIYRPFSGGTSMGPGVTLDGFTVKTSSGTAQTTLSPLQGNPQRGAAADVIGPLSHTI